MPGFELFGDAERREVQDVLDSGILMRYGFEKVRDGKWKAKELEDLIKIRFQSKNAFLCSSGTAALSMSLAASGIGSGDEVIIPSFTFVASFEAILLIGATPIVVDIDETLTLDIGSVIESINDKTKAIMPVHMCGSMANLDELVKICKDNSLLLIEDACQAIGGTYNGRSLGTIGDLGCFSFDFVKTVTCGEGGVVITNNEVFARNLDSFGDHGHDHIGNSRGAENHPYIGYNFRISELNAAVGLAQFRRIDEFLELQRRNYSILFSSLKSISQIKFRSVPRGGKQSFAFLNFFLENYNLTKSVMKMFKSNGIENCFHYYDNNWHYIRNWEHLINQRSLYPLSSEQKRGLKYLSNKKFLKSDYFISRNISCLIKLSWTVEEAENLAQKMVYCIKKVISNS
tara:strand:+ start:97746 stop:98948 length:1203 start_codon:yes stop_codon:yes gene_type:complete